MKGGQHLGGHGELLRHHSADARLVVAAQVGIESNV